MDLLTLFFISSGLFLGWSLGANHAVNVFGTAVMSKMVKYKVAAVVAGIFVILGSVLSGAGATKTLNELGGINALAGSFTVALAVAISVFWMTRLKLPVSTSQSVVGAIIGWNIFTGSPTDFSSLSKIFSTWIMSPVLAGVFGFILFKLVEKILKKAKIHMLELDAYTRTGLIIVGAFASYTLGANNIANVMGLFVSSVPLGEISISSISFSGTHQLFFLGGLAIAVGIYTYGYRVMVTVGTDLYKITPVSGLVVVLAESFVLFIFSSQELEKLLLHLGLPAIPLVPLSSTQAVIGAVLGVGLAKGGRGINYKVLGRISGAWVIAPVVSCIISFIALFFVQNVFEQKVISSTSYEMNKDIITELNYGGIKSEKLNDLLQKRFSNTKRFKNELIEREKYSDDELIKILNLAKIDSFKIDTSLIYKNGNNENFSPAEITCLKKLSNKIFIHKFDLTKKLKEESDRMGPEFNKEDFLAKKELVFSIFRIKNQLLNKKE